MSAKEMFESMNLEQGIYGDMIIYEESRTYVAFLCDKKEIETTIEADFLKKYGDMIYQAINFKCQELGWIE